MDKNSSVKKGLNAVGKLQRQAEEISNGTCFVTA